MAEPSPFEFFEALYPDPHTAGSIALYTTTLRRGRNVTRWCLNLAEADRLCSRYRNSRRVRFGLGLQSRRRALEFARKCRTGVWAANTRGCEASVTALPALWAEIPYRRQAGPRTLPVRRQALGLLAAVEQRPSILVSTGNTICAFWTLDDPWIFDDEGPASGEKAAARALLLRVQSAIAALAAESGWRIPVSADLAASFPVPGFVTGASARDGRAVLETFPLLPGDGRCRRRDFESLPEPPAGDPQTGRRHELGPIATGCSWLRHCLAEGPNLEREDLDLAIELSSGSPGSGDRRLVRDLAEGHPAFDPVALDRRLAELERAPVPLSCARIGALPGTIERHCAGCAHFGRIESPVELAPGGPADAAARSAGEAGQLLVALEQLLDALGGAATAHQITRALASGPGRFAESLRRGANGTQLAAAFGRLAPELQPGDPAAAAALGIRLRALKGRVLDGRVLVAARRTRDGIAWAVRPVTPDSPNDPEEHA